MPSLPIQRKSLIKAKWKRSNEELGGIYRNKQRFLISVTVETSSGGCCGHVISVLLERVFDGLALEIPMTVRVCVVVFRVSSVVVRIL